jgi:hypothetical protein
MDRSTLKLQGQSIKEFCTLFLKPLNWDAFCKNKTNGKLNSRNMGSRPSPGNNGNPVAGNVFVKSAYIDALEGITGSASTMELW